MVQLKDLPETTPLDVFLYDLNNGDEYSANKSDYFYLDDDYIFTDCVLVKRVVSLETILE